MSDQGTTYTYEPIEFYGKVGYDASGQVAFVEVLCNGRSPSIVAHPENGETVADLFERAFEGAKTLLITQRVEPKPMPGEPA